MANHVAVRVVTDDGVVLAAFDGCNQLLGQLGRTHLWLQVVGGDFRRVDQNAVFAFERLFHTTVKEEGHVGVFFGFRDAQLSLVMLRHPLAEGIRQRRWRIGAWRFDVGGIFGQHHEIAQLNLFFTGEAVEVSVDEGAGDFASAVGTEVHEDQRVAIFHCGIGLAFGADHRCFDEFVVFIAGVSGFQRSNRGVGLELAFGFYQQIVGLLYAIPTVVAVHGVVAANDRGHAAFTEGGKLVFKGFQGGFSAARRGVTTIKEGVQVDFFRPFFCGQLDHRHNVVFVTVDTTGREQTHNVYRFACGGGFLNRAGQHRVCKEGAFFNFNIQTGQILVDNASGTQVDVSNFGVAHLTIGQTHFQAGRINQCMRTLCPQCIHDRGFSVENGVILLIFAIAIAIQNHQYHRFFRNRHCDNLFAQKTKNLRNFTTAESIK